MGEAEYNEIQSRVNVLLEYLDYKKIRLFKLIRYCLLPIVVLIRST